MELTYILGPPLALCIGALWSAGAALAVGGVVLLAGTAAFAMQPASRGWKPAPADRRPRGGSMRTPAMQTLVIVLVAVGCCSAPTRSPSPSPRGRSAAPRPPRHCSPSGASGRSSAACSFTRFGGGARSAAGLALLLVALTAGHLALIPADGSVVTLGVVLLFAGAAIAPTEASVNAMVDHAAPAGTMTEAFAWLATAVAIGAAAGAASAGILVDRAGPAAAFALAGGAGALAALTTMLRSRTLAPRRAPATADTTPAARTRPITPSRLHEPSIARGRR